MIEVKVIEMCTVASPVVDIILSLTSVQVLERVLRVKEKKLQTELLALENQGLQGGLIIIFILYQVSKWLAVSQGFKKTKWPAVQRLFVG